ncbi:MAG: ATPase, T2SS/T4P/T4SS family [Planctomycetota bacterium]
MKARLHERLLDEIGLREVHGGGEEAIATTVREFVARVLENEDLPINDEEREKLGSELVQETLGVGPLAPLMADPSVTDILVVGHDRIWVERFGKLERTNARFRDDEHVLRVIERFAARAGRRIDFGSPMVDLRLPDGSRVNATIPPVSVDGPTVSIRRFGRRWLRRDDLVRTGSISQAMVEFLDLAVRARKNLLISGGTGAGKSTLLGAIAEAIPEDERVVTIEDTVELILDQEHLVRLETRPPNVEGRGQVTSRDLVINALRMRPDRILVGEVRGSEALDMLQALNTGHDGGMCTIHANSARDALARLETMVLMAGLELPSRAIREQVSSALHYVVNVRRFPDGVRRVDSITELAGLEGGTPLLQDVFVFRQSGLEGGRVRGRFVATGIVPRLVHELRERGQEVSLRCSGPIRRGAAMSALVIRPPAPRSVQRLAAGARAAPSARRSTACGGGPRARPRRRAARRWLDPPRALLDRRGRRRSRARGRARPRSAADLGRVVRGDDRRARAPRARSPAPGRVLRIENQLAEGIDLMVASLSAGAGPLEALESAALELREPLADEFASVAGRIRLGDAPREAFAELLRRVPLEDMQLFTFTLTVHGESGGSLAPTALDGRRVDPRPHRAPAHRAFAGRAGPGLRARHPRDLVLPRAPDVAHRARALRGLHRRSLRREPGERRRAAPGVRPRVDLQALEAALLTRPVPPADDNPLHDLPERGCAAGCSCPASAAGRPHRASCSRRSRRPRSASSSPSR